MKHHGRRQFLQAGLALAGSSLLSGCGLPPLPGQRAAKVPGIGFPNASTAADPIVAQQLAGLRQGLSELGYVEGRNVTLETRFAEGKAERIPDLVAELVDLPVDLTVGQAPAVLAAAKRAMTTIPIVFAAAPDPVGQGLIAGLARPGGNLTGLAATPAEFGSKQLDLLQEAVPEASRVAVLLNPGNAASGLGLGEMQIAGPRMHLETRPFEVRAADDFARAFAAVRGWQSDALMVINDPLITVHLAEILDFAAHNRLPAACTSKEYVVAGGLMSYAANVFDLWRRAATFIDKILKGAKPADLPVEQPTRFDFVINLKTARALGLTIPQEVLMQATEVIQ